jgi:hypothetical protein
MTQSYRVRVVFHGAVILLVGLLCGYPTVLEEEPMRLWHTAHESLILIGILLFAVSSALPVLGMIAFAGNAIGILGSMLVAALTLMGAHAAHAAAISATRSEAI